MKQLGGSLLLILCPRRKTSILVFRHDAQVLLVVRECANVLFPPGSLIFARLIHAHLGSEDNGMVYFLHFVYRVFGPVKLFIYVDEEMFQLTTSSGENLSTPIWSQLTCVKRHSDITSM